MPITTTGSIVYFKDDLGQPLIGGKVYTYEYSTSKPKDIYKTAVRELPHTNPVILNDSGSVEWYLKGDYTIRVYTSEDVFVEEFDIVAPSKVQVDEVSDSLNLLKSELKNAAYRDTGAAAAQVPLNSDLGTAAYKDVGAEAGNVMEVGAFGLGEVNILEEGVALSEQHVMGLGSKSINSGLLPPDAPLNEIGKVVFIGSREWGTQLWFSYNYGRAFFRNKQVGMDYESWKEFYHSGNTTKDANSFLRDSESTSEVVIKDAAGVATVNGIQAGVDAPKIAYKKLTGNLDSNANLSIAHGLIPSSILNVDIMIELPSSEFIPDGYDTLTYGVLWRVYGNSIIIGKKGSSPAGIANKAVKILITYSV